MAIAKVVAEGRAPYPTSDKKKYEVKIVTGNGYYSYQDFCRTDISIQRLNAVGWLSVQPNPVIPTPGDRDVNVFVHADKDL